MKTKDVRQAFSALRARTGLSSEAFADLLGLPAGLALADYEYPDGTYQHAHLPDELIERMLENLVGEGHPAITRADIVPLALAEDAPARDLCAELVTPSLLADILVAYDTAVRANGELQVAADVGVKARHTASLYKKLTTGAIGPGLIAEIMDQAQPPHADAPLDEAQREAILAELVTRALLVEQIELKAGDGATIAFLRHLLDTRYAGVELRYQDSQSLKSVFAQISAIAAAHEDPRIADADNVVVLRGRSR